VIPSPIQQLALVPRREPARGEPRAMQHGPEAIAGPSEVMARRAGVETRIDAAEEHASPPRSHRAPSCRRREHLGPRGTCSPHPFFFHSFFKDEPRMSS